MDVDPLQDSLPPRYAIESDDSEDELSQNAYPSVPKPPREKLEVNVTISSPESASTQGKPLFVVIGSAGREWSHGVELGQPKSAVSINGVEVGSLHLTKWTPGGIFLLPETLPLWALHPLAAFLLSNLKPSRLLILDSYPAPGYISSTLPPLNPPIRFLRTSHASKEPVPPSGIRHYAPPNLIQSLSASLLLVSELSSLSATLFLLPSRHIPPPAPPKLEDLARRHVSDDWETATLQSAHELLFGKNGKWETKLGAERKESSRLKRRGDIGDGGMYM